MIGNIEEKIIIKHIVEHVTKQNLWDKDQFGFMRKRNTTTAAIKLIQKIAASTKKEKHSGVAILSLDVRKAFDSLSHNMIMRKILKRYNIAGSVANFIHDFLINRHMVVRVGGEHSETKDCSSGCPQGCCSSPPLYSMGIGDFVLSDPGDVNEEMFKVMFADYATIIKALENAFDEDRMNRNLKVVYEYMAENHLHLHGKKFRIMMVAPGSHTPQDFKILNNYGKRIPFQGKITFLGMTLDKNLTFNQHIEMQISKAKRLTHLAARTFVTRKASTWRTLGLSIILSTLEYQILACGRLYGYSYEKNESVQIF